MATKNTMSAHHDCAYAGLRTIAAWITMTSGTQAWPRAIAQASAGGSSAKLTARKIVTPSAAI